MRDDRTACALWERVKELERDSARLQDYLALKVDQKDWHGVADAANDIREVETEIDGVKYALTEMGFADRSTVLVQAPPSWRIA